MENINLDDWYVDHSMHDGYINDIRIDLKNNQFIMEIDVKDWHVIDESLYEINAEWTYIYKSSKILKLMINKKSIELNGDIMDDCYIEITDFDHNNPIIDEDDYATWLFDYVICRHDFTLFKY